MFTINSVDISLSDSEIYHTSVITNADGQAITQIPFGKYELTEVSTPDGYEVPENPTQIIEFRSDENSQHEFTITNRKLGKVIVHHYLKDTTQKLAEDETLEGKQGDEYSTLPRVDIERYELVKDINGEYVLPDNASGTYTYEDIEVIYYYEPKQIPLTVHHYIDGTTIGVPLVSGEGAEDIVTLGDEGENYTTVALTNEELATNYRLKTAPENATGLYEYDSVEVIYYYEEIKNNIEINKVNEGGTPLQNATFTIRNTDDNTTTSVTTDENGKATIELLSGTYEVRETQAPNLYELNDTPQTVVVNRDSENNQSLTFTDIHKKGKVIVHFYEEGTTNKIVPDEEMTGLVSDEYQSTESKDIPNRYILVADQTTPNMIQRISRMFERNPLISKEI